MCSTECKAWIYAKDGSKIQPTTEILQLPTFALPALAWMLDDTEELEYFYSKTYAQAAHDVIVIIHTSGTTGQ